jgi:helicase
MLGRAGRLGKHDRGRVVFLCLGEAISSVDSRSEIEIAFHLMNSDLAPIEPNHNGDACAEQILSICSSTKQVDPNNAREIYQQMIGTTSYPFMEHANYLIKKGFLRLAQPDKRVRRRLEITPLGRAATLSFFSPSKALSIVTLLRGRKHFVPIALAMSPLRNIYLSRKLHAYLEKTYHMRFSTRLINSPVLDVMMASLKGKESTELSKWCLNIFSKWTQNFFKCSCSDNPYCEHGHQEIGRFIVNERLDGKNVNKIATSITKFELLIYPGDVLSFLNGFIHELEGIQRIAQAINKTKLGKKIDLLINRLETPNSNI